MLNLSRIQQELEKAKDGLREVEESIHKVEGKVFPNGPARFGGLKVELHSEKGRNTVLSTTGDGERPRRRLLSANYVSRDKYSANDLSTAVRRGVHEPREVESSVTGPLIRRRIGNTRPQGVFARLSGFPIKQQPQEQQDPGEDEEEEMPRKPSLSSRVFATPAAEAPSRQEVMAAQTVDEQSKQRNRRMFGALVGTLQKFRREETRVKEREEKRQKVEKKLEEDAKRDKEKLMQEKRALFVERNRREMEIKRIEWSLNRVKEFEAWEASMLPLNNFIQTQAQPHIFYLPAVHNDMTLDRLHNSQQHVKEMIEKRKTMLKEEIETSEKRARRRDAAPQQEVEEDQVTRHGQRNGAPDLEAEGDKENEFHNEEELPLHEDAEETGKNMVEDEESIHREEEQGTELNQGDEMVEEHDKMHEEDVQESEKEEDIQESDKEEDIQESEKEDNQDSEKEDIQESDKEEDIQESEKEEDIQESEKEEDVQESEKEEEVQKIEQKLESEKGHESEADQECEKGRENDSKETDVRQGEEMECSHEAETLPDQEKLNKTPPQQNSEAVVVESVVLVEEAKEDKNTKTMETEIPLKVEQESGKTDNKEEENDEKKEKNKKEEEGSKVKGSEATRKRDRSRSRSRRRSSRSPRRSSRTRRRRSRSASRRRRTERRRGRSASRSPRRKVARRRSRSRSRRRTRKSPGRGGRRSYSSSSSSSRSPRKRNKRSSSSSSA